MNNTQQTGVGASDSHPSSPQTASQPTSSQEGIEPKGDNVANNGERASVNGSDEGTRNEQQTMSMVDSMRFVTNLMKKLGIATIAKSLHRGHQYEILKQHPRALRTYESTHVDGAWILGDVDDGMADLTYAERLRHLGVLGGQNIRTQSLAFHHSESADGQASTQSSHASNLHINVPSAPGMVVLAPPHSPDAVFAGFRDPLMYNIRVSSMEFPSSATVVTNHYNSSHFLICH